MALDLTGLKEYVKLYPELLGRLTYKQTILGRFAQHAGQDPGKTIVRIFKPNTELSNCCTTPDGTSSVDELEIEAICLQDRQEFCETELAAILRDGTVRYTAGQESAGSAEAVITDQQLASLQIAIDKLIFQGDKGSADSQLNKLDGLIKQATNSTESIKLNISSGNVYSALQQIILSIPPSAFDMGAVEIYVPREVANALQVALISMNLYHFNPGTENLDETYRRIAFPGFANVYIVPARGLDGTNTIIATPPNNVHWLYSRSEDHMTMAWDYNSYHEKYFWYVKFILGIGFGLLDQVVIATLDPSVITAPAGLPISIVSPIGAGGGVSTEPVA